MDAPPSCVAVTEIFAPLCHTSVSKTCRSISFEIRRAASFARGEIGARNRTLDTVKSQLEDENVLLKSNLSDAIDTDLTDAISQLTSRQAAYQASLQLASVLFKTTLLDFL